MFVVRATSLSNYSRLVTKLGGDPQPCSRRRYRPRPGWPKRRLHSAQARRRGDRKRRRRHRNAEFRSAAGALLQGIEILGPVGVAARTSGTIDEALRTFENFLAAYSLGLGLHRGTIDRSAAVIHRVSGARLDVPAAPQVAELSLGVVLRGSCGSCSATNTAHCRFIFRMSRRPLSGITAPTSVAGRCSPTGQQVSQSRPPISNGPCGATNSPMTPSWNISPA